MAVKVIHALESGPGWQFDSAQIIRECTRERDAKKEEKEGHRMSRILAVFKKKGENDT